VGKKFGGSVQMGMNGKQLLLIEARAVVVHIVIENVF